MFTTVIHNEDKRQFGVAFTLSKSTALYLIDKLCISVSSVARFYYYIPQKFPDSTMR